MKELTRRDVLRLGAAAAGLTALAPILGCVPGGSGKAPESAGISSAAESVASTSSVSSSAAARGGSGPTVYFTPDISPAGLVAAYGALGIALPGKVGVKISTGEGDRSNYLRPDFIADLVHLVDGDIVECNTAFDSTRGNTDSHMQLIERRGFPIVANTVILDGDADVELPVTGGRHLRGNLVGAKLDDYSGHLVLSHFKGHVNGGFGGAIKNMSIGYASKAGKSRIHTAGAHDSNWLSYGGAPQDDFLESMAEAAKSVVDHVGPANIAYVNVMNRLSVDCDCDPSPREPTMADIGILSSLDPVALDCACADLVYAASDGADLVARIESLNGWHTLDYGEQIGLGSKDYALVAIG